MSKQTRKLKQYHTKLRAKKEIVEKNWKNKSQGYIRVLKYKIENIDSVIVKGFLQKSHLFLGKGTQETSQKNGKTEAPLEDQKLQQNPCPRRGIVLQDKGFQ